MYCFQAAAAELMVLPSFGILSSFFILALQKRSLLHGPMRCTANPNVVEGIKVADVLDPKGKAKPRQ